MLNFIIAMVVIGRSAGLPRPWDHVVIVGCGMLNYGAIWIFLLAAIEKENNR
jgi:hypothetical protein